ncbi:MAG: CAP domain-containing protein [Rhodobacteraceae bacterium]|nr:CAP domain-containing protein [Paracoccaceae bacterium]MCP5342293.1 CAP domain-containing protein [Paracoccaceae bacterium]
MNRLGKSFKKYLRHAASRFHRRRAAPQGGRNAGLLRNAHLPMLALFLSSGMAQASPCAQPDFAARSVPELVRLINDFRRRNGAGKLALEPSLMAAAQGHACFLARSNQFTHMGKGSPKSRMKRAGCRARTTGENIAMGFSSPDKTMKLWLESPPHRRILLMRNMTVMGIGVAGSRPAQSGGPRWVLDVAARC